MISDTQKAMLDGDVDLKKLDKLASSNEMIKSRQFNEMVNCLRKCSQMFSFVSEAKIQLIAERLQQLNYGSYALSRSVNKILNDYDKFPSFKVILELVKSFTDSNEVIDESYIALKAENSDFHRIQAKFINLLGEEALEKYTKWWIKNVFIDLDGDLFYNFGLCYEQFKKPALFDWHDAGYTKNFDRILEIANKKKEILLNNKNKHIKYTKRIKIS